MFRTPFAFSAVLLFLLSPGAMAGSLELSSQAYQQIEITGADGQKQTQTVPATQVAPGAEVFYVIRYRNTGSAPADKVVITNPVPPELEYRADSAFGAGTLITVSVDGGKTYGQLADLKVPVAGARPRAAQPADVTHLRWTLQFAVAPGAEGQVTYRARLK
jgi:uncharacterized repeat protein (TIGR01451 family)